MTMEKNSVFGEILYIGFVFEKGRCKSGGIWKNSYIRNLKKHIKLLEKVVECMQKQFEIEEDNILLRKVCHEIQTDKVLKKYYPFNKVINKINICETLITNCQEDNQHIEIINLMLKLIEDILVELDKGLRKDKEKITRMIFSLHNLPRVYLSKNENTLCLLEQNGITPEEAFEYSKLSMDENLLLKYKHFFVNLEN